MRHVAFTETIEPRTLGIWTRASSLSLLRWGHLCHHRPPVARNGLKDTEMPPVLPRYSSDFKVRLPWPVGSCVIWRLTHAPAWTIAWGSSECALRGWDLSATLRDGHGGPDQPISSPMRACPS